jgi:hypothetical protein
MPRQNKNRKRKATNEPGDRYLNSNHLNKKRVVIYSTPSEILANPKAYLHNTSNELKSQPPYASAVLLGLASIDPKDKESKNQTRFLVDSVVKRCPDIMARDATLFRQLLATGDESFFVLLSQTPLISHVSWDVDLAKLAIKRTTCFLGSIGKKNPGVFSNATVFCLLLDTAHKNLLQFLSQWPPLLHHVPWDPDLAVWAVGKEPLFYQTLPTALKTNDATLALAAMVDVSTESNAVINKIVKDVHHHCPGLFSNDDDSHTALATILDSANKELVGAILVTFGDQILWNNDLVAIARDRFPDSYSFFPTPFRDDRVDAQKVMASLLPLKVTNELSNYTAAYSIVDATIAAFPGFFVDQDAVKQLFQHADESVVSRVVEKLSREIPWDEDLVCFAAERCRDEDNHDITDDEIEQMYKENKECKYHLPFGMLLSDIVNDSTANGDWPDFLNHCPCALVQDESVLMKALGFLDPTLDRTELPNELGSWLQEMVRFIKEKYKNRSAFQTLLNCMTVMDENGQRTLELFRGDSETVLH